MTELPQASADAPGADTSRQSKERVLVFIVAFLGLLIVAGLTAVILRIIYLSSNAPAQRTISETAARVPGDADASRLALPAGAVVKSVSVGGDRLAVHYGAPSGDGIAVLDLATGAVVRRIDVVPGEPPRP
jgi:hypothetical protein